MQEQLRTKIRTTFLPGVEVVSVGEVVSMADVVAVDAGAHVSINNIGDSVFCVLASTSPCARIRDAHVRAYVRMFERKST